MSPDVTRHGYDLASRARFDHVNAYVTSSCETSDIFSAIVHSRMRGGAWPRPRRTWSNASFPRSLAPMGGIGAHALAVLDGFFKGTDCEDPYNHPRVHPPAPGVHFWRRCGTIACEFPIRCRLEECPLSRTGMRKDQRALLAKRKPEAETV